MTKIRAALTRRVDLPKTRPVWAIVLLIGLNVAGAAAKAVKDQRVEARLTALEEDSEAALQATMNLIEAVHGPEYLANLGVDATDQTLKDGK